MKIVNLIKHELFAPILLIFMTFLALILNNSSLSIYYENLINYEFGIALGENNYKLPFILWVNDALMAIFFFWVGLEVKKEILIGELRSFKASLLPLLAAAGGVVVPALIYAFVNRADLFAIKGFAIPTATDIAFALGVLLLLKGRIPNALTVFLLSLAIFDDIAAIVMIALFYTSDLAPMYLLYAGCGVLVLALFNYLHICTKWLYYLVGFVIWLFVLKSGVHATLAGITCAFFIPLKDKQNNDFLIPIMHKLTPYVDFFILPIFALFNAGVSLNGIGLNSINAVFVGVFCGLFFGKQIGVFALCMIAKRFNIPMPSNNIQLYGVCILTGIGFTMSFFINTLVFETNPELFNSAKLAILLASLCSAVVGYIFLRITSKPN